MTGPREPLDARPAPARDARPDEDAPPDLDSPPDGVEPDGSAELRYLRWLAETDPPLYTLARALCLAPHAAPAFVRRARLTFVPDSAAGLEADLWFSPLIESADARAMVLDPLIAAGLRHDLSRDRRQWKAVLSLTEDMQREAPELVRRYTRLALADAGERWVDTEAELAGFAAGISAGAPDGASADDLSRWLVHFLPRLPRVLEDAAPARTLLISAAARLAVDPPGWVVDRHGTARVAAARAAATRMPVRGRAELGVRLDDAGLTLSRPPAPGSRVLEVPDGERVRVELAGPGEATTQGHVVELGTDESVRVPVAVFAELAVKSTDRDPLTGRRLMNTETVFGATDASADGRLRAALRSAGEGTELLLWQGKLRRTVPLQGTPRLLRVDDRTGTVLLVAEDRLLVVRTEGAETVSIGGLGEIRDAVVATPDRLSPTRWVVVANEHGVCMVRPDAPMDPPTYLSRSAEVGLRIWVGAESSELVIVRGGVEPEFVDLAGGGAIRSEARADVLPVTAITSAHGGRPLLFAQTGPQLVLMPTPDTTHVVRGGGLSTDIVSVAISRGGAGTAAVDRAGRLLRWDGTTMSGRMREVPLPFPAVSISAASPWEFTVVGRGGPVELRAEDGRTVLLTPARNADPETGWLLDTLVATMPVRAADLESVVRSGIGCVCLPVPIRESTPGRPGSVAAGEILRAAGAAGIRMLVDVQVAPGSDAVRSGRGPRLLRYCAELLAAGAAGVRVLPSRPVSGGDTSTGRGDPTVEFLRALRRLVDEHPGRVLVLDRGAVGESAPRAGDECCHLVLAQGTRSVPQALALMETGQPFAGAVPDWTLSLSTGIGREPTRAGAMASVALALPGLRAVAGLPVGPPGDAVAALLRVRGRERALARGTATRLGSGDSDVVVLSRRYEDDIVVCVANLGTRRGTVALTTPSLPPGRLVDLLDLSGPQPTRTLGDRSPAMVTLAAHEYRWFRLLTSNELYASRS
ncbi:hypothetical protein ACIBSV_05135 [Embleya sp. NPDC050154]|uniref:hypothetical protein n=1 Tax=Embleya sp. NPDC050154 TaxID=3363988 RepID=UPI00378A86FE